MTAASRGIRNVRLGQLWEVAGLHDVDIIGGGLQHFALPRTWKGEVELNRRGMGRGAADSCVRCCSNVGGGLRRLLWLHINEEECQEKMHINVTDHAEHLPVLVHLCEPHTAERSARSEAAKNRRQREEERRREKKG